MACVAHALTFGVTPWFSIWEISHGVQIWFAILLTWPLWIFPLWWCGDGRKSRVIAPLIFGAVALLPGFFIWYVMANFRPG
jgi:hypothetical protein